IGVVRQELRAILGVSAVPRVTRVFRWRRGNPQYDVGHLDRVTEIEGLCPPGLYLTGSAYRGVGLPDCVRQGRDTAREVALYMAQLAHVAR
ncbi:MAG: FAD-dependent oxidoreductase, partial [Chloroflexota bacterium]